MLSQLLQNYSTSQPFFFSSRNYVYSPTFASFTSWRGTPSPCQASLILVARDERRLIDAIKDILKSIFPAKTEAEASRGARNIFRELEKAFDWSEVDLEEDETKQGVSGK